MATEYSKDAAVVSDTEQEERPVREQLRKATISQEAAAMAETATALEMTKSELHSKVNGVDKSTPEGSASPPRKRSFEEVEDERQDGYSARPARHHSRKRSRDSTAEASELENARHKVSGESAREANSEPNIAATHTSVPDKRPGTPESLSEKHGEGFSEAMASPKIKRSRLHPTTTEDSALHPEIQLDSNDSHRPSEPLKPTEPSAGDNGSDETKRTGGFGNTSAASPFASLASNTAANGESNQPSAFAASSFSALSGSSVSGFGALGQEAPGFGSGSSFKKPTSEFPTPNPASEAAEEKQLTEGTAGQPTEAPSTTFGGNLGQKSAFATAATSKAPFGFGTGAGFGNQLNKEGGFGGGFANSGFGAFGGGGGGGLTSFASGKPSTVLGGAKSAKPFGAPPDNDDAAEDEEGEQDEADEAGFKSPLSQDSDKQDERFYAQELKTGEEDERTEYSCRAKLYNFATVAEGRKEWKERGIGILRLNVKKVQLTAEDSDATALETKPKARLVMRADGSHRVILNTPVKKEIRFGAPDGTAPKSGFVYFMGAVEGTSTLELLQLKVRQQFASELYEHVSDLQAAM